MKIKGNEVRILLAIDDSRFSREAIRVFLKQIQPKHTQVRVLHVVEPVNAYMSAEMMPHYVPYVAEVEKDRLKEAKDLVRKAAGILRKAGFRVKECVDTGDPKTQIVDHAMEWHADLIVVGSHGLKGLNRFFMGSVSEAVTRHAGCSVQIVRIRNVARGPRSARSKR